MTDRERTWLLEEKYGGEECLEFFRDLKRLESGEPLAYIIGWVDFLGCRIDLSQRTLIPRTETEWWTERVLLEMKNRNPGHIRILDLFSGSGCIGVALAKHLPYARVDCADISPEAVEQIRINAEYNGVTERIHAISSDVFSNISGTYDYIVANPPYIDAAHQSTLDRSVVDHEPHEALFATAEGLGYIRILIEASRAHLNPGGTVVCEFGEKQKAAVEKLLKISGWSSEFWKDQYGKWRVAKFSIA